MKLIHVRKGIFTKKMCMEEISDDMYSISRQLYIKYKVMYSVIKYSLHIVMNSCSDMFHMKNSFDILVE